MSMTHEEMIAVIKAHSEGKTVQFKHVDQQQADWRDCATYEPSWNFVGTLYRIKPAEPVKRKLCAWIDMCDGHLAYRFDGMTVCGFARIPELDKEITLPEEV